MNNKKVFGTLGVIILILVVVSVIGISYAAFTQQLTINGTATANKSSWKIKFSNLKPVEKTGTAAEIVPPTIEGDTKIGDYSVTLTTPGDSVSYTFDVVNDGTFNAKVNSISSLQPQCSGSGSNSEQDATNVCKHLTYKLTESSSGSNLAVGATLNSQETKTLKLTLTYGVDVPADELPKDDVTITGLEVSVVYGQTA